MNNNQKTLATVRDLLFIFIGTACYAFGIIYLNIPNKLAEGGVTGVSLILRALFGFNPAFTSLILNIPIMLFGWLVLGRRSFLLTLFGTFSVSFWLYSWQHIAITIHLNNDLLIVALLAGFITGLGSGIVYRFGGTTGGIDIIARIIDHKYGISIGRAIFLFDAVILLISLVYIDLTNMMYTLIFSFVASRMIDAIIDGGYLAKGIMIVSPENQKISEQLMNELERGVTFFHGEGGYSKQTHAIIYTVVTPSEIKAVKQIVHAYDKQAFISIVNVHEIEGEFTYRKKKKRILA